MIAGYIKHDKAKRLRHATELFKCLKLALIATELDFDALGSYLFCPSKRLVKAEKAASLNKPVKNEGTL